MTDSGKPSIRATEIIAAGIARDSALERVSAIDRSASGLAAAGSLRTALNKATLGISSLTDPSLASAMKSIRDMDRVIDRLGMHEPAIERAKSVAGLTTASSVLGQHHSIMNEAMNSIAHVSDNRSMFSKSGSAVEEAMKSVGALSVGSQFGRYSSAVEEAMKSLGGVSAFARESPLSRALDTAGFLSSALDRAMPRGILGEIKKAERFGNLATLAASSGAMDAARKAMGLDLGGIGALTRSRHWAETLSSYSNREMAAVLGTGDIPRDQFDQLQKAATSILDATHFGRTDNFLGRASAGVTGLAGLESTFLKLSLFASATDVFGPDASGSTSAFTALMGGYRSRLDLEPSFWRDTEKRTRVYRDADVDGGLIDADNAMTLEILVESGVVEGRVGRRGSIVAVVEAGPVRMHITARQTRLGAYRAIDAFEISLRAFVAAKLEEAHGPLWFKQRVPGDVANRAKDRKREAMRSGEAPVHPIHFVDLGDLIHILLRKDNWAESFEAVFQRGDWLRVDLERLTAIRRPVMHARMVDGVQLCEMVLTIRKLTGWMEKDGNWDNGWDDDT